MSFDTLSFVDIRNKFMRTLFQQECYANMKLYAKIVVGISKKARPSDEEEEIDGETNRVVTLKDVTDSIIEVEPKTPVVILRELTEDAVTRGKGGALVSEDEKPFLIHLSDVMRVIGTAPILRRSPLSPHEDCVF
ncbi:hypothetical protein ADEAN_000550200 [Angomonas deanei]|uniref:Uncharacterized protein n=1 Tax=Angomonas deanei TaxID=59799 RepID=A0A7G2CDW1_9TRYP|nr:hypothetical protein ADEAN_000550200 [Angomonas deanei]